MTLSPQISACHPNPSLRTQVAFVQLSAGGHFCYPPLDLLQLQPTADGCRPGGSEEVLQVCEAPALPSTLRISLTSFSWDANIGWSLQKVFVHQKNRKKKKKVIPSHIWWYFFNSRDIYSRAVISLSLWPEGSVSHPPARWIRRW